MCLQNLVLQERTPPNRIGRIESSDPNRVSKDTAEQVLHVTKRRGGQIVLGPDAVQNLFHVNRPVVNPCPSLRGFKINTKTATAR